MPTVALHPVTSADRVLLADWVARPHVRPWWGDPAAALSDFDARSGDAHALVHWDGRPVGYLCWERLDPAEAAAAGLTGLPDGVLDVDALIGEPDALGRGLAPAAGRLLLDRFRHDPSVHAIGAAMSVANTRSLRAAEKLGFRVATTFEDPEHGPCRYAVLRVGQ